MSSPFDLSFNSGSGTGVQASDPSMPLPLTLLFGASRRNELVMLRRSLDTNQQQLRNHSRTKVSSPKARLLISCFSSLQGEIRRSCRSGLSGAVRPDLSVCPGL